MISLRARLTYILTTACAAIGLTMLFRLAPALADAYRLHIFQPLSRLVRIWTDSSPLALTEILLIFLLFALFLRFRPRRLVLWGTELLCLLSTLLLLYAVLWGPLYACTPIPAADVSAGEVESLCIGLIGRMNELSGQQTESIDTEHITRESARLMSSFTSLSLSTPRIVRHSGAFSALGIAGMYVPFTFEALMSSEDILPALRFTACHELAHQAGWAREEEASFIALMACLRGDADFQYSGCFSLLTSAMRLLRPLDEDAWQACVHQMNWRVLYDFRCANGLDEATPTFSRRAQEQATDTFLRVNGQSAGLPSYDRVVGLALAVPSIFHNTQFVQD